MFKGWRPSQRARLALNHYNGPYFLHIQILDAGIRYRLYGTKNRCILDVMIT